MAWPDLELIAVAYLSTELPLVRVVTVLPGNLEAELPVIRVTRGPGGDDGFTDQPLLDCETFTADRASMWALAEDARQALHALAGQAVDGFLVDTVNTATGPTYVDYGNVAVSRAVASYRVELRQVR